MMEWLVLSFLLPYIYLIIRIATALDKIRPFNPVRSGHLFVSVIIPCRNEEKNLPVILSCLKDQSFDREKFEVIVTDDNSTDSTFRIADEFSGIKNLIVIRNKGAGKKSAIRSAIEESSGSFIITTDADCRSGENWLSTIASFLEEKDPAMAILPVRLECSSGFLGRFQELEFLTLQGITAGTVASGKPVLCNGANLAFRKDAYLANSENLHPELVSGDDVFLLHNMKQDRNNRILWLESPEAAVTTKASGTLFSFLKQRARWISKAGALTDRFTMILGIVTFVTICTELFLIASSVVNHQFLNVFLSFFIIKSVVDFFLLIKASARYGSRSQLKWFLPVRILYPFYVVVVALMSGSYRRKW